VLRVLPFLLLALAAVLVFRRLAAELHTLN
jgi:hypothetical protein